MSFTPTFLDDLRSRLSLNELVGRHIELKRHGDEFKGLCPFHNEKTPSFTINESKGFFHCFGCEAHGDIFGFVMQFEGLSFVEAVERLADECGVPVPAWSSSDDGKRARNASLIKINELAASWFEECLKGPKGKSGREYLAGRGMDGRTAKHFRLGFAPDSKNNLEKYMAGKGVDASILIDSGLVRQPDDGRSPYDFFRGRVIFPIVDRRKQVIGFGGRTLGAGHPKYINSPETSLFKKGLTLYNVSNASRSPGASSIVVVAEGYMDVIALHCAGYTRSVAPLGTALTSEQINLLWRIEPEPVLCFDGDSAGRNAAYRAALRALPMLKAGHSLSFVFLPDGHDPDSMVSMKEGDQLRTLINNPVPLVDFVWEQVSTRQPVNTPERKAAFKQQLRDIARNITDKTVQRGYTAEFKKRLYSLFDEPSIPGGKYRTKDKWISSALLKNHARGRARTGDPDHRERVLVATLIGHPDLIKDVRKEFMETHIRSQKLRNLKLSLLEIWDQDPSINHSSARAALTKRGHGETVGLLFDRVGWNQTITEPSIQPESNKERALMAWKETLAIHQDETEHSDS